MGTHGNWIVTMMLGFAACGSTGSGASDAVEAFDPGPAWECVLPSGPAPAYATRIGCAADFITLASRPLDSSIPGARSSKTIVDLADGDALYFLNAEQYPIHYHFAAKYLSGKGPDGQALPMVGDLTLFNSTEYYSPYRRFLLGAVTYYEEPKVWAYEIAPYDSSLPDMVVKAYDRVAKDAFFGGELYFHPTSKSVERLLPELPSRIKIITSDELFKGVTFLPLNLGEAVGQLRFYAVADLESKKAFVSPRDIAVLDSVPNDISVVAGLITAGLQTPLSHVCVLSQNRGTPDMSLVGAMQNPALRALENRWVRLTVTAFDYTIEEVTKEVADAWWEAHKPPAVKIPALDLTVTEIKSCSEIGIADIPAFGGKASHYGELTRIGAVVPVSPALALPVYYYKQFEQQNGFDKKLDALLADPKFSDDPAYREQKLGELRDAMEKAPVDPGLEAALKARLDKDFPGVRMRFRSSTNAEDLDGFTGAGLYESKTYDPADPNKPMLDALRKVWASLWRFRAFEERSFRGIDHRGVAMAILMSRGFPAEDANGVALTANLFDAFSPAFYINVQKGDTSVVLPPEGVTTDQIVYFFTYPGQPATYLAHSSLVPAGETVLTNKQLYTLGKALDAIHARFLPVYGKDPSKFFAMDVEFKFNTEPGDTESKLWIKQARPHYGWSGSSP